MDAVARIDSGQPRAAARLAVSPHEGYELRFQSLFHAGRALAFPCDAHGDVRLDALSERARQNYRFAREVVGREFASPVVYRCRRPGDH